jgi:hypothetical protein
MVSLGNEETDQDFIWSYHHLHQIETKISYIVTFSEISEKYF